MNNEVGRGRILPSFSRSGINEFGLSLRFWNRAAIFAQALKVHRHRGPYILLNFSRGGASGGASDSALTLPLGVERPLLIDPPVGVGAEAIPERLKQVRGKPLLPVAVDVTERRGEGE